jgi:EmrB/QacA subfamily drug resistance transporter
MTTLTTVIRPPCDEAAIRARAAAAPAPRHAEPWILAATILGSSLSFIDGTVVNVALPTLQREFGAGAADVQWVIEAYALFLSALILVGGSLGDQLGRRRVFALGIALFTLASIGCGLAPSLLALIIARAVQGIGGALLVPASLAIISASFDEARRGRAIGTWSGFTTVTSALGPVLGGFLVQSVSWRAVFFLNVPVALVTLAIVRAHVPESRDTNATGRLDWRGAALATIGLGALVFGLIESSARGLGDALVVAALLAGVVALALFVLAEAHGHAPMMPLELFRSRGFTGANLLTLLLYAGLGGALYFLPFNLQQVQGYSPAAAGAALLPMTVIIFALSRWSGGLVRRYGAKPPLVIGPLVAAAGFALFALPGIGGSYWTTYFPAIVVLSLGMALVIAPLTTTVMNAAATEHAGAASGINNAVSRAAGLIAIAALNLVVARVFSARYLDGLAALPLPATVRAALAAQSARLAGIELPAGLDTGARQALEQLIATAFLGGFRAAMLIGAALALASAVTAALLIPGKAAQGEPARERTPAWRGWALLRQRLARTPAS